MIFKLFTAYKMSVKHVLFAITLANFYLVSAYKPVYLVHGIMTGSISMELIKARIEEKHPGTIVYNTERFEGWSSLENMWYQTQQIGQDIMNVSSKHPEGIHLLGYSQGALLSRTILQAFPEHNVNSFISLSGPQAGQYGKYLPFVNNELPSNRSESFKRGLTKLKKMVLIGGPDDNVITPWESSQFGYFDANDTVTDFVNRDIYKKDLIGLKTLDQRGDLKIVTVPGINHFQWHLNISIVDNYILPYLD